MSGSLGMKLLVVTDAPPAQASGTNIVLRRLLQNFDPGDLVVLARRSRQSQRLAGAAPPYPLVRVPSLPPSWRGARYWAMLATGPGLWAGRRAARKHGVAAILGIYPDEGSLLTAYLLSRWTGLPLLAYFFDLYLEDRRAGWQWRLARWLQPRVFRDAEQVWVVNQGMGRYYRQRYNLDPLVLPACINARLPEFETPPPPKATCVIGYSGNINATRLGSLRALVSSLNGAQDVELHYFTPHSEQELREFGVWTDKARARYVADEGELIRRLQACDILFLPQTFEAVEHSRDQLATAFGIKSYEYFMSLRPILLHAAGDTFIARFYREHRCGLVVDDPSPASLAAGVQRLREDLPLRTELVRNALQAARQFEGATVAERVRTALKSMRARLGGDPR
jgi:hypothetical protein